jgi:hypothetical protein
MDPVSIVIQGGNGVAVLYFDFQIQTPGELQNIDGWWQYLYGVDSNATNEERIAATYSRQPCLGRVEFFFGKKQAKSVVSPGDWKKINEAITENLKPVKFHLGVDYYS